MPCTRPCATRRVSLRLASSRQPWGGSGGPSSTGHLACIGRGGGPYTSSSDGATATRSSAEAAGPSWSTQGRHRLARGNLRQSLLYLACANDASAIHAALPSVLHSPK